MVIPLLYGAPLQSQFLSDCQRHFDFKSPVIISTEKEEAIPTLTDVTVETTATFITYTVGQDEGDVAQHLLRLKDYNELDAVLFLHRGHGILLQLLTPEVQLFNKDVTWIISESKFPTENSALRLDSNVYLYQQNHTEIIELQETYAVKGTAILKSIGTWQKSTGFSIPQPRMWERRKNLAGINLRVTTISKPHVHELFYDDSGKKIIGAGGFFIDPLYDMASDFNFTLTFIAQPDGKWGALDGNGTWNGLVGMLAEGRADIAAAQLSRTKERGRAISYSITLKEEVSTLATANAPEKEPQFWIYVEILPTTAWLMCLVIVMGTACGFTFINASGLNYLHDDQSHEFNIIHGIGLSLMFLRQIYYHINTEIISSRILFLVSGVTTYLIYTHYTAYLTARTTSGVHRGEINSFDDVLRGGFRVITLESGSSREFLKTSKPGTAMHEVYYGSMHGNPSAFVPTFEEIERQMYQDKKTLYFGGAMPFYGDGAKFLQIQGP